MGISTTYPNGNMGIKSNALRRLPGAALLIAVIALVSACNGQTTAVPPSMPSGTPTLTATWAILSARVGCEDSHGNNSGNCSWHWYWRSSGDPHFGTATWDFSDSQVGHSDVNGYWFDSGRENIDQPNISAHVADGSSLYYEATSLNPNTQYEYMICGSGDGLGGSASPNPYSPSPNGMYCMDSQGHVVGSGQSIVYNQFTTEGVPVPTADPTISYNGLAVGDTFTATNGSWTNNPLSYSYQWYDCPVSDPGPKTGGCAVINGATNSTYVLRPSDVGYWVSVVVTAYNGASASDADLHPPGPVTSS